MYHSYNFYYKKWLSADCPRTGLWADSKKWGFDNNEEEISKIDKIISKDEINIQNEGILKGQGNPITKKEILELFEMEKSMCKISYENIRDNEIKNGKGTGLFCKIDNYPIKYALFTNNHILNENNIKIGNKINIEYFYKSKYKEKKIEINEKRRVYTNKELDYTCIELNELDDIKNYFEIDPILLNGKNYLKNSDIYILQYSLGNELSFSCGKIISLKKGLIYHSASTEEGSSGSPIIRRSKNNYIILLHLGSIKNNKNIYSFNLATTFDSILND